MLRITLRTLAARKLRLALTAVAVVLGVAFVAGTLVLTDTSSALFDEQFADVNDGVDLIVRTEAAFGAAMGVEVERDPVDAQALAAIEAVDGVKAAVAQVQGQALLFDPASAAIVPSGPSIGLSWTAPPVGAFPLRSGAAPDAPGEVAIDTTTAAEHGIGVGDRIDVQGRQDRGAYTVTGIVGFGDRDGLPDATVALFDYTTAGQVTGLRGGASQVLVVAEHSGTVDALRDAVAQRLGDGYEISTSRDTAAASAAAAKAELLIVQLMLLAIAATALVVGAFLIANTFSITVTQRIRELAVLRAVGATGRQLLASVLIEAAAVGAVASVLGAALGVAASYGLRGVVAAAGVDLPEGRLVVAPRTLVLAVAIGTTVTVLSAVAAARRAARVAPVQAMRSSDAPARGMSWRRRALGGLTAVGALGLAITTATGITPAVAAAGASVALTIASLAVLAPAFAGPLAGVLGRPLRRVGVAGTLARETARRAPRRVAATTSALAIGLAVVTFMTVLAASVRHTATGSFDETISADLVIESARDEMLGGLSAHLHHEVSDLDEVGASTRLRFGHWQQDRSTKALTGIDPATLPAVVDLDVVDGSLAALADGGVAISENIAEAEGLSVGDSLPMIFARTGTVDVPVRAIFDRADQWAVNTGYLISLATYAEHFTEDVDAVVFASRAPGVSEARLRAAVDRVLVDHPTAVVRDQAEARRERTAGIDRILALVTVLLLFAVLIALLGITNTLALSIIERTREVGLLRAVGMTRNQVRAMIRWEALLIAALGAVLGVTLGIGFSAMAVRALSATATIGFTIPGGQLAAYLAVAGVAGVVAGVLPARRAARLDVLDSIAAQ
jgi:putative ABC transport system permease protein